MTSKLSPEMDSMAAEFALGVLEGEARAKAQRHVLSMPEFAAAVAKWQGRLDPLGEAFAEAPPPNLWRAIEARLDVRQRKSEIRQLRFWRGAATLSGALAASLAAVVIFTPPAERTVDQPAPAPSAIAQLAGQGETLLAANLDLERSRIKIRAVTLPSTELVPELWIIPGDGVPRSLGLIRPDGTTLVVLPAELKALLIDGAVLAVSLEKAEGAPHVAPSSTPIATGKISTI